LLFKDLLWLLLDKVFHNLLPLLEVDHADMEERVGIEDFNNLSVVGLDEFRVHRMASLHNRGEKLCEELMHGCIIQLAVFRLPVVVLVLLKDLNDSVENDLHRPRGLLNIRVANNVTDKLAQNLLECHKSVELSLSKELLRVQVSSQGVLDLLHEVRLVDELGAELRLVFHEDLHVLENTLLVCIGASTIVDILEILFDHLFQLNLVEENRALDDNIVVNPAFGHFTLAPLSLHRIHVTTVAPSEMERILLGTERLL